MWRRQGQITSADKAAEAEIAVISVFEGSEIDAFKKKKV